MPTYRYQCKNCLIIYRRTCSIAEYSAHSEAICVNPKCINFHLPVNRLYDVPVVTPIMHSHLNSATGTVVSSATKHADDLKRASDAATARTGMEHRFVPHDNRDPDVARALGVTDEGLDVTRRRRRDAGLDPGPTIL